MVSLAPPEQFARGIVIRPGPTPPPAGLPCWAYLWTEDPEEARTEWHRRLPVARPGSQGVGRGGRW